jgi:regulator of protease activity HflC (stomatin/prohibitin superfamily)
MGSQGNAIGLGVFILVIILMGSYFGWINLPDTPATQDAPAVPFDWTGIIIALIVIPIGIWLLFGIKVIRPVDRGAIETLGKFTGFRKSGLTYALPVIQHLYKVNITETLVDIKSQQVITEDNLNATVDAQVYYKVGEDEDDLKKALYKVRNYDTQIVQLARTTLRNVIGTKNFKDVNSKRGELNHDIFETMEKETKEWGINIIRVELKEIEPPKDVQDTMNEIIKADNTKVAQVDFAVAKETEAKGDKLARIQQAIGFKQEKELIAQGEAKAITVVADADKTRIEKIAQGEAEAIKLVNDSANKHFIENAKDLKALEITQGSLENNTKYIVTEKGISPNLIIDGGNGKDEQRKIIPYPYDRRKGKGKGKKGSQYKPMETSVEN